MPNISIANTIMKSCNFIKFVPTLHYFTVFVSLSVCMFVLVLFVFSVDFSPRSQKIDLYTWIQLLSVYGTLWWSLQNSPSRVRVIPLTLALIPTLATDLEVYSNLWPVTLAHGTYHVTTSRPISVRRKEVSAMTISRPPRNPVPVKWRDRPFRPGRDRSVTSLSRAHTSGTVLQSIHGNRNILTSCFSLNDSVHQFVGWNFHSGRDFSDWGRKRPLNYFRIFSGIHIHTHIFKLMA